MQLKRLLFIIIILCLFACPAIAGDETELKELCKNGGIVNLEAKTYTIQNSFEIPGNIELLGQGGTVFKFADECGIPQNIPMISIKNQKNIVIKNIRFEGNQEHQTYALKYSNPNHPEQSGKKAYGNQVGTFIYAINCDGITVTNCAFNDNLGDGLRLSGCSNIEFSYNTGTMGGHDTFFALRSSGIKVHHNSINPLVNSAIRLLDTSHVRVYSNYIEWIGPRDAGPAIQIQHDKGTMEDIEVCDNVIMSSCGPGLWLVGKTGGGEDLSLHHNLFYNCGDNRLSWVGGIIASGYDGAVIENNVFDNCWLGGACFYAVNAGWGTEATATISKNIFTNAKPNQLTGIGGYGIYNNIGKQDVVSSENCFYANSKGNYYGSVESSEDISENPKTTDTPSDWYYNDGWQCPDVNPKGMAWYTGDSSLTEDELRDAEQSAQEFDSIFDIFKINIYTQVGENDTVVLPEGMTESKEKALGTIEYQTVGNNTTTLVKIPEKYLEGVSEVRYEVDGKKATHTLLIGERTSKGVVFTETSIWAGDLEHSRNNLKLSGRIDAKNIQVECVTPTDTFLPIFEVSEYEYKPFKIHPAIFVLLGIVIFGVIEIIFILKHRA